MKSLLPILFFLYSTSLLSQHKYPYNTQNKDQGTYLVKVDKTIDFPRDTANILIRIFQLSRFGCKEVKQGTVIINHQKFDLTPDPDYKSFSPVFTRPGKFTLSIETPFSFLTPLTTKKLKFKKGYTYNISFFLLSTIPEG